MLNPSPEPNPAIHWLAFANQTALRTQNERANETASVLRALDEALAENERAEILAQFDRAIILLARSKRWRSGMQVTQRVYAVVQTWQDFDASAYARTLAQFTFNYALEFQQAHVLGAAEDLLRDAL